ncbi:MAG TPA: zf-HC2 domain-containing protein [Ignavibacteriaceae bacterium]|nr:zf-HC2 domain-containing protein [Ignavibacteriaceae bacterium]
MNHEEAKKLIDEYADGSLDPETAAEVKKHINECRECSAMVEQIQNLMLNIKELPEKISPPHDLWKDIFHQIHDLKIVQIKKEEVVPEEEEIADEKEEKIKEETRKEIAKKKEQKEKEEKKREKEKRESNKNNYAEAFKKNKIIFGTAVSVVLIIIVILIKFSGGVSWQVSGLQGQYKINGKILAGGELNEDDALETFSNSAVIIVPEGGSVNLNPWSKIQRKEENVLLLLKGGFTSESRGSKESFRAQVFGSEIKCKGASVEYKTEFNNDKSAELSVFKGKVIITGSSLESIVIPGFICSITEKGPGIPVNTKSSNEVKKAFEILSFYKDQDSFNKILNEGGLEDGVSLWHLLKRINGDNRGALFNKLYSLYVPPKGVDQESILRLKDDALNSWLEKIAGSEPK